MGEAKIIKPQEGGQNEFVRSNVDVCFFGGTLGGGKTFGAILSVAEATLDPNFKAIFLRKNLGDLKTAGGVVDGFKEAYGDYIKVKESDTPRITFPTGAYVEARHLANEDPKIIKETWKGVQADAIFWEELTGYEFGTFVYIMSRCRGKARWSSKIRATLNPKKSHWVRKWLDWYITPEGYIDPERDGKVRYFYLNGDTVDDLVWGNTKEEVYRLCRIEIDRKLKSLQGKFSYKDLIKSFRFIKGNLAENKALLKNNPGYIGNVASTGAKDSQILIEGNWNIDEEDDNAAPIPHSAAMGVFDADPCENNEKWITADLADEGKDNTVILVWKGFHIIDIRILPKSSPKGNCNAIMDMADKYGVGDTHIIYDGVRAAYVKDYIEDARPFYSYNQPEGKYSRQAHSLKDACYLRLVYMINNSSISFSPEVANSIYKHQNLKYPITVQNEFVEECSVVRFKDMPTGKKKLLSKKEMNQQLGKGRSMDLLDPIAMRMKPALQYSYGDELSMTGTAEEERYLNDNGVNIYDPTFWA